MAALVTRQRHLASFDEHGWLQHNTEQAWLPGFFQSLLWRQCPGGMAHILTCKIITLSLVDSGMHQREHELRTRHPSSRPKVRDADIPLNFFAAGFICTVVPHKLDCSVGGLTMHFLMRLCPAQIRMSSEQMCVVKECQRIEL